jgi:hypothetical protein
MVDVDTNPMKDRLVPVKEFEFKQQVVNIGSHPENDLTITGDGILPFHAMLIAQDGGYSLVRLTPDAVIFINGDAVEDEKIHLAEGQRVTIGEYALAVQHSTGLSNIHVTLFQSVAALKPTEYVVAEGEEVVLLNVVSAMADVPVEQSAMFDLEVINAGPIVASFYLAVKGVPEEWVQITPPEVNLNEGRRATVKISITAPRAASSTAGKHPISIIAMSPNYPGHYGQVETELNIQPFCDFSLGTLSPKHQNIFWKLHSGKAELPINNQSNCNINFNVTTLDDENGCSFDYQIKEGTQLNRQATFDVATGTTYLLPIEITPLKQPIISMRSKSYHYTTTVQPNNQPAAPQIVSGSANSFPLFGWWSIVLAILLLVLGLFFLVQPRIYSFQTAASKDVIESGDSTTLDWSVSPFTTRLAISNIDKTVEGGQGHLSINPTQSTTYELTAGNWLSGFMSMDQRASQTVLVVPPTPTIAAFEVDKTSVDKGKTVTLRWSVTKAEKAYLTIGDVVTELTTEQFSGEKAITLDKDSVVMLEAKNASGSELRSAFVKVVPPHIDITKFIIWVRPPSSTIPGTATSYLPKTDTPGVPHLASLLALEPAKPLPGTGSTSDSDFPNKYAELVPDETADTGYRVELYTPNRQLSKGEQLMVEWQVAGTDTVTIAPFTDTLPNLGKQPYFPQESMNFVLTAKSGELQKLFMLPVKVFDGEDPVAPTIKFFQAVPTSGTGDTDVQFSWSVTGAWTHIQLSTADGVVADWLNPSGFETVTVSESGTYILTAWNGDLSTASPVDITIKADLLTPTLEITGAETTGLIEANTDDDIYISITGKSGVVDPTGTVTISDDYDTCTIKLPTKYCTLTFTKASKEPKVLHATYSGDTIYKSVKAEDYSTPAIIVYAKTVELAATYAHYYNGVDITGNSVVTTGNGISTTTATEGDITITRVSGDTLAVGQGLEINVTITPQNSSFTSGDTTNQVTARLCPVDTSNNSVSSTCETYGPATAVVSSSTLKKAVSTIDIANFSQAGTFAILLTYSNTASTFSNLTLGNTTSDRIFVTVGKGTLVLVPSEPAEDTPVCTYLACVVNSTTGGKITFNPFMLIDTSSETLAPLYSSYTQPSALTVTVAPTDTTIDASDWTSLCSWANSGQWILSCSGVTLKYKSKVTYPFTSADSNYAATTDILTLSVKEETTITNTAIYSGLYVGQTINLMGGNNTVYTVADTLFIDGASVAITSGGSDTLQDILGVVDSSNCTPDSTTAMKTLTLNQTTEATKSSDVCRVYFKKAGTFSLTLTYAGTSKYAKYINDGIKPIIAAQTGIGISWNPDGTSAFTWNPFTTYTFDVTFACTDTTTCTDFAPAALSGVKVDLSQATTGENCSVYQGSSTEAISTSNPLVLPTVTTTSPVVSLNFTCTDVTSKEFTLAFASGDKANFSTYGDGSIKDATLEPLPVTIVPHAVKNTSTSSDTFGTGSDYISIISGSSSPYSIASGNMYVGDELWFYVDLTMPSVASPAGETITMTTPTEMDDGFSSANTTCTKVMPGKYTLTLAKLGDGTTWRAKCEFKFSRPPTTWSTGSNMAFTMTGTRFSTSEVDVNLPDGGVPKLTATLRADVRMNKTGSSSSTFDETNYKTIVTGTTLNDKMYIGEEYWFYVTVAGVSNSLTPNSGSNADYVLLTWPSSLDGYLVPSSTCTKYSSDGSQYKLILQDDSVTNQWAAACKVKITADPGLTGAQSLTFGLTSSYYQTSGDYTLTTANPMVDKRALTLTASVSGGTQTSTAGHYYAKTSPLLVITFAESHTLLNAIDDWSTNLTFSASSGTVTDYIQTSSCAVSGSTVQCPLVDSSAWSEVTITASYAATDAFDAASTSKKLAIEAIPVDLTVAASSTFPATLACRFLGTDGATCGSDTYWPYSLTSGGTKIAYTDKQYELDFTVATNPSGIINDASGNIVVSFGSWSGCNISIINGGSKRSGATCSYNVPISNNAASFKWKFTDTTTSGYTYSYAFDGTGTPFVAGSTGWGDVSKYYVYNEITFTYSNDNCSDGIYFNKDNLDPAPTSHGYHMYLEVQTTNSCASDSFAYCEGDDKNPCMADNADHDIWNTYDSIDKNSDGCVTETPDFDNYLKQSACGYQIILRYGSNLGYYLYNP